jgi:glycosyltransferase involved in cell wall biosynthesis
VAGNINAVRPEIGPQIPARLPSAPHGVKIDVTPSAPRLSVVINTLNEERDLEDCLRSLDGFADEIVVVDMHSEDRTVEIARRYAARIVTHERTGVVEPARQFAIDQARGEWIFLLDADERVTPDLVRSVRHTITTPGDIVGYCIPMRVSIAGRWMTGTGWGPDVEWHLRLFRNGAVSWPREVHSVPIVRGRVANLIGPSEAVLLHYNYRDLREFVERLNIYTDFEAEKLQAAGEEFVWQKAMDAAVAEVRRRYEPQKDGVHSLILSLCMAFYRLLSWAKLWERCGYPQVNLPGSWEDLLLPDRAVRTIVPASDQPSDFDRGEQALHVGAWVEACDAYIEVLRREPVCAAARSGLGLALLSLGETEEGLAQLEEGVRLHPGPDLVNNLACGYMHVGRFFEAEQLLSGILAAAPQHEPARVNLGRLRNQAQSL